MRSIITDKRLTEIWDQVKKYADEQNRTLPEIRNFVLNEYEFMSLLEKGVYPVSPPNFWEGQDMTKRKQRVEEGLEGSIYYEVVQTCGNPDGVDYVYLNHTNNDTMQASVMAHIIGHCEFACLNIMQNGKTEPNRTEKIMWLTKKVNMARQRMGDKTYNQYWVNLQSLSPFVLPNSRFNLENSVEDYNNVIQESMEEAEKKEENKTFVPVNSTLNELFKSKDQRELNLNKAIKKKEVDEEISRKGFSLKMPCEDIFGFLRKYSPTSTSERCLLDYTYEVHKHQDFVRRTQIMNEGWAMYWEKEIMLKLFADGTVDDIVDYAKCFSGVTYPRPFFQRNPYQVGFNMWHKIKERYEKGMYSKEYYEEKDINKKLLWNKPPSEDSPSSLEYMESIVKTSTDYNFIEKYVTHDDIAELYLNRVPVQMGIEWPNDIIIDMDDNYVYLDCEFVKSWMLNFFTSYNRPRIYIVDTDYENGGLLLFHREDDKKLKTEWILPTCHNISKVWKAPVHLISNNKVYSYINAYKKYNKDISNDISFDDIIKTMKSGNKIKVKF